MSRVWQRLCVLLFAGCLAANAELLTFQFQGHIIGASPGLNTVFQAGRPYTLSYTFETTVPPSSPGLFISCIRDVHFNYDNSTYVGTMDPLTMSGTIRVSPDPFNRYSFIVGLGDNVIPTSIDPQTPAVGFPQIGDASFLNATVTIFAPFSTYDLPTTIDFQSAETKTFTLRFQDLGIPSVSGTLESFQVVPEPSTWLLLTIAAPIFCLLVRRKRASFH